MKIPLLSEAAGPVRVCGIVEFNGQQGAASSTKTPRKRGQNLKKNPVAAKLSVRLTSITPGEECQAIPGITSQDRLIASGFRKGPFQGRAIAAGIGLEVLADAKEKC
jgi:hypothetical protein